MLYLEPETILDRLSDTISESLLATIDDDPSTAKYNVILLRNTLRHVANQTAFRNESLKSTHVSLLETLEDLERLAVEEKLATDIVSLRESVADLDRVTTDHQKCKDEMNDVVGDLLSMINGGRFGTETSEARGIVYDHFETRVDNELDALRGGD